MSGDHVTLRIPKKVLGLAVVLLIPGAFVAGIALGGGSSESSPVSVASTTLPPATTIESTTTTVATSVAAQKVTTTLAKKKKKVVVQATTSTVPPAPSLSGVYSDNCPAPGIQNKSVAGTGSFTWKSTSVIWVDITINQGNKQLFAKFGEVPNGQSSFPGICNDVVDAAGNKTGQPYTVIWKMTGHTSDGKTVFASGEDKM